MDCEHKRHGAKLGCEVCTRRVRAKHPSFPLQMDSDNRVKPGPLSVPWPVAEKAWAAYHQRWNSDQSVERLAERGGFGWSEMDTYFPGWREATDEWVRLRAQNATLEKERAEVMHALTSAQEKLAQLAVLEALLAEVGNPGERADVTLEKLIKHAGALLEALVLGEHAGEVRKEALRDSLRCQTLLSLRRRA